jgi:methyl-accepting chemotaxis protein
MKNIPIIGKFLLVLSAFGLFTLAVAAYVSGQMWTIDSSYSALGAGSETAAIQLAVANGRLLCQTARKRDPLWAPKRDPFFTVFERRGA